MIGGKSDRNRYGISGLTTRANPPDCNKGPSLTRSTPHVNCLSEFDFQHTSIHCRVLILPFETCAIVSVWIFDYKLAIRVFPALVEQRSARSSSEDFSVTGSPTNIQVYHTVPGLGTSNRHGSTNNSTKRARLPAIDYNTPWRSVTRPSRLS